ncbi:MAG TPA: serine/threonine-protein kinase [Planctomycetota bacterium]|nr:serine/threonine-protein kinase [Planctomycetota bacterium]HQA99845.1 serine/threonine-protein kinase [Planctomycetota bacterium]
MKNTHHSSDSYINIEFQEGIDILRAKLATIDPSFSLDEPVFSAESLVQLQAMDYPQTMTPLQAIPVDQDYKDDEIPSDHFKTMLNFPSFHISKINIGQTVHDFEILEKLGQGSMGTVYKALDRKKNQLVALKMLNRFKDKKNELTLHRFLKEATLGTQLDHPNIAKIYTVDIFNNNPYLVMEYIHGIPLLDYINSITENKYKEYATLFLKIVQTIEYIHQQNIIHSNIKPSNIIITKHNEPILLDVGLSKMIQFDNWNLTKSGEYLGTIQYMAPELLKGEYDKVDTSSDIYSLGTLFYTMLTKLSPYPTEKYMVTLYKILALDPQKPKSIDKNIPQALENIVIKAMQKIPNNRYKTVSEIINQLQNYLTTISSKKNIPHTPFKEQIPETEHFIPIHLQENIILEKTQPLSGNIIPQAIYIDSIESDNSQQTQPKLSVMNKRKIARKNKTLRRKNKRQDVPSSSLKDVYYQIKKRRQIEQAEDNFRNNFILLFLFILAVGIGLIVYIITN